MEFTTETVKELGAVGAIIFGALWAGRFILTRMAGVLDKVLEMMMKHEERSVAEHKAMIEGVRELTNRPCMHEAAQGGGD